MNLIQLRKATMLLGDYIHSADNIVLDNGMFALQVTFKDGHQKVFGDIQHVIDWVQVQKLRAPFRTVNGSRGC